MFLTPSNGLISLTLLNGRRLPSLNSTADVDFYDYIFNDDE